MTPPDLSFPAHLTAVPVERDDPHEGDKSGPFILRGGVWRKPNPKVRGDEQKPDTRCGTPGTSWHVTAKSSIHGGACFINPASTHGTF